MSRIYSRFKTILASILIACIALNLFPLSLLALDEPYYSLSEEYEFSVTRVISSRWEDHANIDFIVTNNGDTTIDNWYITTDLPYDVENIWNASIAETSDSYITISSAPQNQPIEPGCSVTFGITGYSEDDTLFDVESSFYLLNIEDVVIPVEKYQATTNVYSTNETSFSGAIAITNISSELLTIENVVLNSTNGLTINGNAAIEDETTLAVDSSSRNIYPSASIYINFEGTEEIPEVLDLRYTGLAFTLTEDENENGILDIDELLYPEGEPIVTPTPIIAPTNTPNVEEPTLTPTVTPEEEPTPSTTPEVEEPTPTPEEVTPTPTPEITEEYLYQDDDADGLINSFEIHLGYDVSFPDTDNDGILDINEDFDLDGLTNGEELNLELSPISPDSDYDGINDYDEIYVYNSNPTNEDTDGDRIHDGDELILGKTPTDSSDFGIAVNQTISREINNVEDPAITSVDITMDCVGNMETSVSVDDLYNIDTYSTDIYSRIGSPLGFNSEFDFDSATVVIHYDDTMLGDTSEDKLGVLWFDEEHGVYIIQDQAVVDPENNTVTLELEHFSTYVLVDIDGWRNAFSVPEASNGYMIAEDTSGYFASNESLLPSIDEHEANCFAWWKLFHLRLGTFEIVERLRGVCYQESNIEYTYEYTWLVRNITDKDNDGLYDCYERDGMLLSNGTISYSSTTTDDSDGDGISDLEEAGIHYVITRDANGRITVCVNEQKVLSGVYYIDASSPYYYLNDYINTSSVTIEDELDFWVPISDPNNPDSDEDGALDFEDATPWATNQPINYILYYEDFAITGLFGPYEEYERYFIDSNSNYETHELSTYEDFLEFWTNMTYIEINGVKKIQYSYVENLIIICHGYTNVDAMVLPNKDEFVHIGDISNNLLPNLNCHIVNLDLQMCFGCRETESGSSIASEFVVSDNIDYVYASPVELHYDFLNEENYINDENESLYVFYYNNGIVREALGNSLSVMYRKYT